MPPKRSFNTWVQSQYGTKRKRKPYNNSQKRSRMIDGAQTTEQAAASSPHTPVPSITTPYQSNTPSSTISTSVNTEAQSSIVDLPLITPSKAISKYDNPPFIVSIPKALQVNNMAAKGLMCDLSAMCNSKNQIAKTEVSDNTAKTEKSDNVAVIPRTTATTSLPSSVPTSMPAFIPTSTAPAPTNVAISTSVDVTKSATTPTVPSLSAFVDEDDVKQYPYPALPPRTAMFGLIERKHLRSVTVIYGSHSVLHQFELPVTMHAFKLGLLKACESNVTNVKTQRISVKRVSGGQSKDLTPQMLNEICGNLDGKSYNVSFSLL